MRRHVPSRSEAICRCADGFARARVNAYGGDERDVSPRALAAKVRAAKRWYVYLILCRSGAIYTGIARNVAARYAQHVAGTGARYTRANPPSRLLVKFACLNQSEASRMEAAIKRLAATNKRKLVDKTGTVVRKLLFG
jgi:putative endonuclease